MEKNWKRGIVAWLLLACVGCGHSPTAPGGAAANDSRASYRITGYVEEEGNLGYPIRDAVVRLTASGLTATTASDGTFAISTGPSVSDQEMEVSKAGYVALRAAVPPVNGPAAHIQLHRTTPRRDYSGSYTIVIGDGRCTQLPASLRQRQYTGTFTQTWPYFEIRLNGDFDLSNFGPSTSPAPNGNVMHGYLVNDDLLKFFSLWGADWTDEYGQTAHPDLAERLPTGGILVISGSPSNAAGISNGDATGVIDGAISLYEHGLSNGPSIVCAGAHPFSLTPE